MSKTRSIRDRILDPRIRQHALLMLLLTTGFGMFLGWNVMDGTPTAFMFGNEFVTQRLESLNPLENLCYMAILVISAIVFWKTPKLPRSTAVYIGAPALVIGTLIAKGMAFANVDNLYLAILAKILFAGSALLGISWGERLCLVGVRNSLRCIAGAYSISYLISLIGLCLPPVGSTILQTLIPLGSALTWLGIEGSSIAKTDQSTPSRIKDEEIPWGVFFGIGIFGATILLALSFSEGKSPTPNETLTLTSGLVTSLALLIILIIYPKRIDYTLTVRLLLPIIVGCIFLVHLIETDQQPYEVAFIGFSWTYFIISAWFVWRIASQTTDLPAICVFALGLAIQSFCSLTASLISNQIALPFIGAGEPRGLLFIAAVCIVAILASTFLLSDQRMRRIVPSPTPSFDPSDTLLCRTCSERSAIEYGLTEQERAILALLLTDKDNVTVARELCITQGTLRTHLRNIYKKMGVHSKQELVAAGRSFAER